MYWVILTLDPIASKNAFTARLSSSFRMIIFCTGRLEPEPEEFVDFCLTKYNWISQRCGKLFIEFVSPWKAQTAQLQIKYAFHTAPLWEWTLSYHGQRIQSTEQQADAPIQIILVANFDTFRFEIGISVVLIHVQNNVSFARKRFVVSRIIHIFIFCNPRRKCGIATYYIHSNEFGILYRSSERFLSYFQNRNSIFIE